MKNLTSGFSLVEVTMALGIAAFSLVSILGLIPVGLNSSAGARRQTEAVSILSSITADLRSMPSSSSASAKSSRYGIPIGTGTTTLYFSGAAQCTSDLETSSQYRVVVTTPYVPSASSGGRRATWARMWAAWPATANANIPQRMVETCISLDRN